MYSNDWESCCYILTNLLNHINEWLQLIQIYEHINGISSYLINNLLCLLVNVREAV
jgi:hypothetical protein